tara:strand:+ start:108 stop:707 length:600 start_codon:yes stop_codon:yes gene_type:complete
MNQDILVYLSEETKSKLDTKFDMFGNTVVKDFRPNSCQMNAIESGQLFEDVTEDVLRGVNNRYDLNIGIQKKPKFKCHYGLDRQGDFAFTVPTQNALEILRKIHIECKQLGNAESHFDKLDHCLMNLINRKYGDFFWLVYDYDREGKRNTLRKINLLVERCKQIKEQVAIQGISFELVLIDDLPEMVKRYSNNTKTHTE